MTIAKEEIFGPVMQILKYHTIDEAIDRANATEYGLASVVIGKDIDKCLTVAHGMRAGVAWVNCYGALSCQGECLRVGLWRVGVSVCERCCTLAST